MFIFQALEINTSLPSTFQMLTKIIFSKSIQEGKRFSYTAHQFWILARFSPASRYVDAYQHSLVLCYKKHLSAVPCDYL